MTHHNRCDNEQCDIRIKCLRSRRENSSGRLDRWRGGVGCKGFIPISLDEQKNRRGT